MPDQLDEIDRLLLDSLQQDASTPAAELAERAGLSQSSCWRRVQRLRDSGYIRAEVALLDRSRLSLSQLYFVLLRMRGLDGAEWKVFVDKVRNTPEIVECYSAFGEIEVLLKVLARSEEDFDEFHFRTIRRLPGVIDAVPIGTRSEVKYTTARPLVRSAPEISRPGSESPSSV
jgi:Lrp/AsnC family transcriptional regulator